MTNKRRDEGNAQEWLKKARADLKLAKRAMDPDDPICDLACFHAQQCAEKSLKAFLIARNIAFQRVHDLVYLTQLSIGSNAEFESLLGPADILADYASRVRYPIGRGEEPGMESATEALQLAERFYEFIVDSIKV